MMKVAAYQAPLLRPGSMEAIALIAQRIRECESAGVQILCSPEAILGGLADNASDPRVFALDVVGGQLAQALAPLASETVTTIVGFTEITAEGQLFNSAAVYQDGIVTGVYRKLYPAINRSVYAAGDQIPVFTVAGLTFGILICNDSNFVELARLMAAKGATALFVPSNNALPENRASVALVNEVRNVDIARAIDNRVSVIRADVTGRADGLVSFGASAITDFNGRVLQSAPLWTETVLIADIDTKPRRRRGADFAKNRMVAQEYGQLAARECAPDAPAAFKDDRSSNPGS